MTVQYRIKQNRNDSGYFVQSTSRGSWYTEEYFFFLWTAKRFIRKQIEKDKNFVSDIRVVYGPVPVEEV